METAYTRIETALINQLQQPDRRPLPGDIATARRE